MAHEFDPWATSAGLVPLFSADVNQSYFEFDPEYNSGDTLVLKMQVQSDDPEVGREGNGSDMLMFPCGQGWTTEDKGKSAVHESGKPKNFNNQSGMGILLDSAKEVEGLLEVLRGKGGGANEAGIWEGLNLTFERKPEEFVNAKGETVKYNRLHVVGMNEGAKGSTTAPAASAPAATPAVGDDENGVSNALKLKLKMLAKKCATHDEFIEKALGEVDGVAGVDAAEAFIMDEANYTALVG